MTQLISFQYRDPEDTELLNRRWEGIIEPGVKQGFEVTLGTTDPDPATTITIRPGVLVTNDYCRVQETDSLIDVCDIPENASADPRWDLVVCEHRYLRSNPPPVAEYYIVQGTPDASPVLPDIPENCIPLAFCYIPAGETQYTQIVNFITHMKYNCYWDDSDDSWHIRFGAKMALLISITPNDSPAMDVHQGMRIFIHPGGVADGDPITWTRVMELTPDGFTELLELAQEVIDARGSRATLDDRLDESLNEDGTYKRVGILDQVMDEVELARGSMGSLDARLDVSLNNDGSYKRVGLLDDVMDEVEDARGSKPDLDARLDVSLNDDGTIKPSALQEKIAHAHLTDMPDSGGSNGDHDGRYWNKDQSPGVVFGIDMESKRETTFQTSHHSPGNTINVSSTSIQNGDYIWLIHDLSALGNEIRKVISGGGTTTLTLDANHMGVYDAGDSIYQVARTQLPVSIGSGWALSVAGSLGVSTGANGSNSFGSFYRDDHLDEFTGCKVVHIVFDADIKALRSGIGHGGGTWPTIYKKALYEQVWLLLADDNALYLLRNHSDDYRLVATAVLAKKQ